MRVDVERDEDGSRQAWVDGAIGDDHIRFLLDTGASRCRVPHVGGSAGLVALGTDQGVGGAGVSLGEDEVVVPELRIGDVVMRDVDATRSAPGAATMPLLGMSALRRYVCEFRLADGEVALHASAPDRDWHDLADLPLDQPMVPVDIAGTSVLACWDTGAGFSAFDVAFADAHPHLFERHRRATGFDSADVALDVEIATVAGMRAGDVDLAPSTCVLLDFTPLNAHAPVPLTAVLGVPVILQADWWFDFPGHRWSVAAR